MANYAYLSLWFRDWTTERGLTHFGSLLTLFPLSSTEPWFRRLLVRGVDTSQAPLLEREFLPTVASLREQAVEFLHGDCSCEVTVAWDLWQWRLASGPALEWSEAPSSTEFILFGEEFDAGCFRDAGHVQINLGLEHLYTGHAGVLGGQALEPEHATSRPEQEFGLALLTPLSFETYRLRTRENVHRLYSFLRQAEKDLPVARHRLWSEGEADFAARTEEILAGS